MPSLDTGVAPDQGEHATLQIPVTEQGEDAPRTGWVRRHRLVVIAAAVVIIGGATGLTLWLTGSSPAPGLVVTDSVVPATRGTIEQTVASSGTIEPASQASLNFAVSGTVTAVNVAAGQTVTAGQVVATVDTTALQDQLDSAEAQLAAAQDKLSSDDASGATASAIDSDQAAVTSAQSSLTTAQTNLSDASLTSTISGTVASVSLSVGQQVTGTGSGSGSGDQGAGATGSDASDAASSDASSDDTGSTGSSDSSSAQIMVIGTDSYLVNTTVDDTEVGLIAVGDQATITPSGSTTTLYGTVASVGEIATTSSDVATFPVVIDVTGSPSGLFAGSTANVAIIYKELPNVVEVPTAAITYAPSSGQAQVTKVVNGKHVVTSVTVGQASAGETQIVSGVSDGDRVVERVVKFTGVPGAGGAGVFGGRGTFGGGGTFGGAGAKGFPTGGSFIGGG